MSVSEFDMCPSEDERDHEDEYAYDHLLWDEYTFADEYDYDDDYDDDFDFEVARDWDVEYDEGARLPTRQERREARGANQRKMRVSGRSTLLLAQLATGPQTRRRDARRKRGVTK